MNTRFRSFLVVAAILTIACGHSGAITQPEGRYWTSYDNAISSRGTSIGVGFLGRVTALDLASGVAFSIQERDADGNDLLLDLALPLTAPYPAIGAEIRVDVSCILACSDGNLVGQRSSQWFVTWCDPVLGAQVRYGNPAVTLATGSSEPENFEFIVVDENGVEATGGTTEDAY